MSVTVMDDLDKLTITGCHCERSDSFLLATDVKGEEFLLSPLSFEVENDLLIEGGCRTMPGGS